MMFKHNRAETHGAAWVSMRRPGAIACVLAVALACGIAPVQAQSSSGQAADAAANAAPAKPLSKQEGDLFIYVTRDNASTVRRLLEQGANPNVRDENGQTPMTLALQLGSLNAFDALMASSKTNVEFRNSRDESPLMFAAIRGHLDAVTRLIRQGAHVNKTLWSPLHYAAAGGGEQQLEIARLLLAKDAYIDPRSPNDTTPLMMAAQYGSDAMVQLLLAEGADPTMKNQLGLSAADFAARVGRDTLAQQLNASAAQLQQQREQPRKAAR